MSVSELRWGVKLKGKIIARCNTKGDAAMIAHKYSLAKLVDLKEDKKDEIPQETNRD